MCRTRNTNFCVWARTCFPYSACHRRLSTRSFHRPVCPRSWTHARPQRTTTLFSYSSCKEKQYILETVSFLYRYVSLYRQKQNTYNCVTITKGKRKYIFWHVSILDPVKSSLPHWHSNNPEIHVPPLPRTMLSPNTRHPDADGDGRSAAAGAGAGGHPAGWARPSPGRRPPGTGSRRTLCRRRTWPPCRCAPSLSRTWPLCAGAASASCFGTGLAGASSGASRTACAPPPRPRRRTSGMPLAPPPEPYTTPATPSGSARSGSASEVGHVTTPLSCTLAARDTLNGHIVRLLLLVAHCYCYAVLHVTWFKYISLTHPSTTLLVSETTMNTFILYLFSIHFQFFHWRGYRNVSPVPESCHKLYLSFLFCSYHNLECFSIEFDW